ncbi:MAG: peptidoglycan-binding protein [Acidobacteria bacterium]|nr:peptidoglycan-binding protein [Acidobacteriota bacterium]
MAKKFNYAQIQGAENNANVSDEFVGAVEAMAQRLETKPEYIFAAMSFETDGTFSPSIQNQIGATGLIQFLKPTANALGTTTDELKRMTPVEQLEFVEKYFAPFAGRLDSLEAVYTTVLSGTPRKADEVLFKAGTPAYKLNPLDWNGDGEITAAEATVVVAARLFGGVKRVQQRLVDLGFVPANPKTNFVDGNWGANTSKVLAAFQKSKRIAASGLMNEKTRFALFPDSYKTAAKSKVLASGDAGETVKRLQYDLITLGYLEMERVGAGFGNFGAQTKSAVVKFQTDLSLPATGKFGEPEQKAVCLITTGVARGNTDKQIVRALQNRLLQKKYLTQTQVNSGYGNFGLQTEAVVKKLQKENHLRQSGTIDAQTFKILFNENAVLNSAEIPAKDGEFYTVAADILITARLAAKVERLAEDYFRAVGERLIVTSGFRPPPRQALAMYNKIVFEGEAKVRDLYANKTAINEILNAFRADKGVPQRAVEAMTKTIENQMRRTPPVFISNHLLDNAFDARKTMTDLKSLQLAASENGGRVIVEGDHYHVELK